MDVSNLVGLHFPGTQTSSTRRHYLSPRSQYHHCTLLSFSVTTKRPQPLLLSLEMAPIPANQSKQLGGYTAAPPPRNEG